eukprot:scaffold9085_cov215-Amphora_coffeaeformis.AAC.6
MNSSTTTGIIAPSFSFKPIQAPKPPIVTMSSCDISLLAVPTLRPSSSASSSASSLDSQQQQQEQQHEQQQQQQQQQQPLFISLDGNFDSLALPSFDDDDDDDDDDDYDDNATNGECRLTFLSSSPVRLLPRFQPPAEDLYYY